MAYASPNAHTYDLHQIAARFGQDIRTPRYKAAFLQRLIEKLNFPKPLPLMVADRLTDDVRSLSKWNRSAVDCWFDDRNPSTDGPDDPAARRMGERAMDARAEQLGLRLLSGGRA